MWKFEEKKKKKKKKGRNKESENFVSYMMKNAITEKEGMKAKERKRNKIK